MKASSDPEFTRYKNLDFADAKPVAKTPHLKRLQAIGAKSRITMRVDSDVVAIFRARAELSGGNYQTMMNDALKQFAQGITLGEMLDRRVRDAIGEALRGPPARQSRRRAAA
jgi:uncharacterized protein (DUF4415 family)